MRVLTVSSWAEFIGLTTELDGWAFRGQADARWPLQSSLSRYLTQYVEDRGAWGVQEQRAIRIFRRKAHNYISDPGALYDDLRCVGMMQHHGAPTRLLDFTKSPHVAAFFALERALGISSVYALNTPALWLNRAVPTASPQLTRDFIDPRSPGNFEKLFLSNEHSVIWFGEPAEMDQRLIAQAGMFVVPGVIDQTLEEILAGYGGSEELLCKIELPIELRKSAMRELYRLNITNASLFPDLDGLAHSVALELEMVWPPRRPPDSR
ncbi:MAG TPA: FRG domain-containing protein [Bordetella sp.]